MGSEREEDGESDVGYLDLLSCIYAFIVCLWGIILPMAVLLSLDPHGNSIFLSIFHVYIDGLSLVFMLYIQFALVQKIKDPAANTIKQGNLNHAYNGENVSKSPPVNGHLGNGHVGNGHMGNGHVANGHIKTNGHNPASLDVDVREKVPDVAYGPQGVILYVRLGALAFGTGYIVLDAFRLLQYIQPTAWTCLGAPYLTHTIFRMLFILLQTYFIFKNDRVVINTHKYFVKFALCHLMATNLCNWTGSVIVEASHLFHTGDSEQHRRRRGATAVTDTHGNYSDAPDYPPDHVDCSIKKSLNTMASPYLFPFAIEYSLIGAAVMYIIYCRVGTKITYQQSTHLKAAKTDRTCHKANKGIFAGLLPSILVIVSLAGHYLKSRTETQRLITSIVSSTCHLMIDLLMVAAIVVAVYQMRVLGRHRMEKRFDLLLLFIAATGIYILHGFMVISTCSNLATFNGPTLSLVDKILQILLVLAEYLQVTLQITFISDGFGRRARDETQSYQVPGRAAVTYLMMSNFCLWTLLTFQIGGNSIAQRHEQFYGNIAWVLIFAFSRPLGIFFRFHSSACLSEIWSHAYMFEDPSKSAKTIESTRESEHHADSL